MKWRIVLLVGLVALIVYIGFLLWNPPTMQQQSPVETAASDHSATLKVDTPKQTEQQAEPVSAMSVKESNDKELSLPKDNQAKSINNETSFHEQTDSEPELPVKIDNPLVSEELHNLEQAYVRGELPKPIPDENDPAQSYLKEQWQADLSPPSAVTDEVIPTELELEETLYLTQTPEERQGYYNDPIDPVTGMPESPLPEEGLPPTEGEDVYSTN